jgi:hypothetical protein
MRMQQRRKTAATWTSTNEVLLAGELGVESDTSKWKVGDGTTAWNSLAYQPSNAGISAAITAAVNGIVNGAPGSLDALNELAAALGNDANFATTVTNSLATKAPLASPALTGVPTVPTAAAGTATTQAASTAFVTTNFVTATIDGTGGVTLYLNGTEL